MHAKAINVGIYEWHTINAWACYHIIANKQGGPGELGILIFKKFGLVKAHFYSILKTWAQNSFGPVL